MIFWAWILNFSEYQFLKIDKNGFHLSWNSTDQRWSLVEFWQRFFFWQPILNLRPLRVSKKLFSKVHETSFFSRRICSINFTSTLCICCNICIETNILAFAICIWCTCQFWPENLHLHFAYAIANAIFDANFENTCAAQKSAIYLRQNLHANFWL